MEFMVNYYFKLLGPIFSVFVCGIIAGCSPNVDNYDAYLQRQKIVEVEQKKLQIEDSKKQIAKANDFNKDIIDGLIKERPAIDQFADFREEEKIIRNHYKGKGIYKTVFSKKELEYDKIFKEWNLFSNNIYSINSSPKQHLGMTAMGVKFEYSESHGEHWSVNLDPYRFPMSPEIARKVTSIEAYGYLTDAKTVPYYREATIHKPSRYYSNTNTVVIEPFLLKINMTDGSSIYFNDLKQY